jgi:four helix bundle protein
MEIFWATKDFPKEERYSLIDQIRRSSRSVPANIVEGWSKRYFENVFKRHLIDAMGSCNETKLWLDFAYDSKYLSLEQKNSFQISAENISKMLYHLIENWRNFQKDTVTPAN